MAYAFIAPPTHFQESFFVHTQQWEYCCTATYPITKNHIEYHFMFYSKHGEKSLFSQTPTTTQLLTQTHVQYSGQQRYEHYCSYSSSVHLISPSAKSFQKEKDTPYLFPNLLADHHDLMAKCTHYSYKIIHRYIWIRYKHSYNTNIYMEASRIKRENSSRVKVNLSWWLCALSYILLGRMRLEIVLNSRIHFFSLLYEKRVWCKVRFFLILWATFFVPMFWQDITDECTHTFYFPLLCIYACSSVLKCVHSYIDIYLIFLFCEDILPRVYIYIVVLYLTECCCVHIIPPWYGIINTECTCVSSSFSCT